ncbi:MAG: hypothetical protein J6I49_02420 [Bacteroidales bacterium]|nr:hypothetical protein [Bacteroidales bacterium]
METLNSATATSAARPAARQRSAKAADLPKTPESELMEVEEFFDIVWKRYLEKHESLQR